MTLALLTSILIAYMSSDVAPPADWSGPTRLAHCRLDEKPMENCRFTPVDGDGSFLIETSTADQLRLTIFQGVATLSVPMGEHADIPMVGTYHRDRTNLACWVTDLPRDPKIAGPPQRICVYL